MERSWGTTLSSVASAVLIGLLIAAFVAESFRDVMLYYGFVTINPLLAGVLAIGVIGIFAAVRSGRVSETMGTGVALGLGLTILLIVTIWALTGRVDIFFAPGWAFPAQRWILVGISMLIVLGAGLRAWNLGLLPLRGHEIQ